MNLNKPGLTVLDNIRDVIETAKNKVSAYT